jgi:hypothetical protein
MYAFIALINAGDLALAKINFIGDEEIKCKTVNILIGSLYK